MSEDAQRPNISPKVRAAIAKPLKFYFPVPSIDLTNWLVVEAGKPRAADGAAVQLGGGGVDRCRCLKRQRAQGAVIGCPPSPAGFC